MPPTNRLTPRRWTPRRWPEALTRLQRRASQEPEGRGPASQWLRELEAERAELSRRITRRLSLWTEGSLTERLGRLEAVALKPLPLPPGEGETLLLEGKARWPSFLHHVFFFLSWSFVTPLTGAWVAVPLFLLFYTWFYLRSGHYWLTTERLMWKPRLGRPSNCCCPHWGRGRSPWTPPAPSRCADATA
ncbi:hypothetical protein ACN28E_07930 [Archangium lansingense]|uniref:hypothetical protein n=1 Tax=Archangium lansingense TaxID=2995310 RepID=UPI003B7C7A08